jgi:hypothetical protein
MTIRRCILVATFPLVASVAASPANAQSKTTYIDIDGGLGYSTNPRLEYGDDTESVFARASIQAYHAWTTERSVTALTAFVENSTYFDNIGSQQLFDLGARRDSRVSERTSIFGSLNFSGDFGGQLGTRLTSFPTQTVVPQPVGPGPITVLDPDLISFRGRQYRLSGEAGLTRSLSARDSLSLSLGAEKTFFSDDLAELDFFSYKANGAYNRQLNEKFTAGAQLGIQRTEFEGGSTTSFNPQITGRLRLSQQWDASAAVGVNHVRRDLNGVSSNSTGLSFDASLCRTLAAGSICAQAARLSQSTALQNVLQTTSASLHLTQRLDEKQTVQAALNFSHSSGLRGVTDASDSTYYSLTSSYQRKIKDRLSLGGNASLRKLNRAGIDPKLDASVSISLRYRLGDLK